MTTKPVMPLEESRAVVATLAALHESGRRTRPMRVHGAHGEGRR